MGRQAVSEGDLTPEAFEKMMQGEEGELSLGEQAAVDRLVHLGSRAPISLQNTADAMMLRFSLDRWQLIMRETLRRLEELT